LELAQVEMHSFSHIGTMRNDNQDSVSANAQSGFALICDGVGGSGCGGFASKIATRYLESRLTENSYRTAEEWAYFIGTLMKSVHDFVKQQSRENFRELYCSTTCTVVKVLGNCLVVGHVGDTRLFHLSDRPTQITQDHTVAEVMRARGIPDPSVPDEARGALSQSIGGPNRLYPETLVFPIEKHDRFLLTTDGVHGVIGLKQLAAMSKQFANPLDYSDAVQSRLAQLHTSDNYSAVVLQIMEV
jgi:serine/threonine protein phosphatase PrpC